MAKQIVDIGTVPNDGTGDSPRVGGGKINDNFTEIYDDTEPFIVNLSDVTSDLVAGVDKAEWRAPYAGTLTAVRATVSTAPTGSTIEVDINKNGTTVLSTILSIDTGEETSVTAATPPVISVSALANDDILTFDLDQIGSTVSGKQLVVYLYFKKTFA